MMELHRVWALVYRDLLIIRRSKWRLVEMFYFPITTMIMWGFFSAYTRSFALEAGLIVLIISLFWNFAYVAQSTINMQMMEDSWSGSLKQLLTSGVTEVQYVAARLITSTFVSIFVLIFMFAVAIIFGWNPLPSAPIVTALVILTLITSLAMGILITALITVLGRSYGFLAWTALQAFILLSAPFFPKEVFPGPLRYVSEVMPYTYIFEGARALTSGGHVPLGIAAIVAVAYFVISWPVYVYCFRLARKNGSLARLG